MTDWWAQVDGDLRPPDAPLRGTRSESGGAWVGGEHARTNLVARSLHDLGLAAWFGGTLMGAAGVNESGSAVAGRRTAQVAGSAWSAWTPVNLVAIVAYLIGGVGLTVGNRERVAAQQGVAAMSVAKTAITLSALGATGYARMVGQKVISHPEVEADSGVEPAETTPVEVAAAQRQLRFLQWIIPALTGSLVVMTAAMGEQQRPTSVARGIVDRLNPLG